MQECIDIDIDEEIDIFQNDDIIDDVFYENDFLLDEEPDIVKELREEERMGKLTLSSQEPSIKDYYSSNIDVPKSSTDFELQQRPANYNEAYQLARKALNQLDIL